MTTSVRLQGGMVLMGPVEEVTFDSARRQLHGLIEFPEAPLPAPAAILCHGVTNSKTTCPLINETAQSLLSLGCVVFRFDFAGSGRSEGYFRDKLISEMIVNLEDAISLLSAKNYVQKGRISLWGRSVGASVAAVCSKSQFVATTVLVSAILNIRRNFYGHYIDGGKKEYTPVPTKGAGVGQIKGPPELSKGFFEELDAVEARMETDLAKARSVLVIQGDADHRVDIASAKRIYELVGEPRALYIVKGADHAYSGCVDEVLAVQRDWYQRNLLQAETAQSDERSDRS